ncbi:MAG TPA: hypothetical protein VFL41_11925 [Gaiellaceae bacterium]|nr:hypothetical protein [Gaiellaceae bacterium]
MTRALALLASAGVLAAGCGDGAGEAGSRTVETRPERGDDGPRRDLRIPRPDLQGYDLLDVIVDGVDAAMGPYFVFEALESATRGQRAIYALW